MYIHHESSTTQSVQGGPEGTRPTHVKSLRISTHKAAVNGKNFAIGLFTIRTTCMLFPVIFLFQSTHSPLSVTAQFSSQALSNPAPRLWIWPNIPPKFQTSHFPPL